MSFDPAPYRPNPSNWFLSKAKHQGWGVAQFGDPDGRLEGTVEIDIDDRGTLIIEMVVETLESNETFELGPLQFLAYKKQTTEDGRITLTPRPDGFNPCNELTVTTNEGVFQSTDCMVVSVNVVFGRTNEPLRVSFHAPQAHFDANTSETPLYWVLPLQNFLSDAFDTHPTLDRHPLRVYPTPEIPANVPEEHARWARWIANAQNSLIVFEFDDQLAFIERLPDYPLHRERLLSRQVQTATTAVMVGPIGDHPIDPESVYTWLPIDLLPVLGLATGQEVSAPWAELRSARGTLVRRIHRHIGIPIFSRGRGAMDEGFYNGTGALLTAALKSRWFGTDLLRATLKQVIRAGFVSATLEDRLVHCFRAIEGLSKALTSRESKRPEDVLPPEYWKHVQRILRSASRDIRSLAREANQRGMDETANTLELIADRVPELRNVEPGLGRRLKELLHLYELPDAMILEKHYKQNRRAHKKEWISALSFYRGMTLHEGFIDFDSDKTDPGEVWEISVHLHDVLMRIILKMLGYDGLYHPAMATDSRMEPLDWVTPEMSATALGYRA